MIEGTRTYKGKSAPTSTPSESTATTPTPTQIESKSATENVATARGDAANPERRKLFTELLPMAGQGLVKILRESNLLKGEIERAIKKR